MNIRESDSTIRARAVKEMEALEMSNFVDVNINAGSARNRDFEAEARQEEKEAPREQCEILNLEKLGRSHASQDEWNSFCLCSDERAA